MLSRYARLLGVLVLLVDGTVMCAGHNRRGHRPVGQHAPYAGQQGMLPGSAEYVQQYPPYMQQQSAMFPVYPPGGYGMQMMPQMPVYGYMQQPAYLVYAQQSPQQQVQEVEETYNPALPAAWSGWTVEPVRFYKSSSRTVHVVVSRGVERKIVNIFEQYCRRIDLKIDGNTIPFWITPLDYVSNVSNCNPTDMLVMETTEPFRILQVRQGDSNVYYFMHEAACMRNGSLNPSLNHAHYWGPFQFQQGQLVDVSPEAQSVSSSTQLSAALSAPASAPATLAATSPAVAVQPTEEQESAFQGLMSALQEKLARLQTGVQSSAALVAKSEPIFSEQPAVSALPAAAIPIQEPVPVSVPEIARQEAPQQQIVPPAVMQDAVSSAATSGVGTASPSGGPSLAASHAPSVALPVVTPASSAPTAKQRVLDEQAFPALVAPTKTAVPLKEEPAKPAPVAAASQTAVASKQSKPQPQIIIPKRQSQTEKRTEAERKRKEKEEQFKREAAAKAAAEKERQEKLTQEAAALRAAKEQEAATAAAREREAQQRRAAKKEAKKDRYLLPVTTEPADMPAAAPVLEVQQGLSPVAVRPPVVAAAQAAKAVDVVAVQQQLERLYQESKYVEFIELLERRTHKKAGITSEYAGMVYLVQGCLDSNASLWKQALKCAAPQSIEHATASFLVALRACPGDAGCTCSASLDSYSAFISSLAALSTPPTCSLWQNIVLSLSISYEYYKKHGKLFDLSDCLRSLDMQAPFPVTFLDQVGLLQTHMIEDRHFDIELKDRLLVLTKRIVQYVTGVLEEEKRTLQKRIAKEQAKNPHGMQQFVSGTTQLTTVRELYDFFKAIIKDNQLEMIKACLFDVIARCSLDRDSRKDQIDKCITLFNAACLEVVEFDGEAPQNFLRLQEEVFGANTWFEKEILRYEDTPYKQLDFCDISDQLVERITASVVSNESVSRSKYSCMSFALRALDERVEARNTGASSVLRVDALLSQMTPADEAGIVEGAQTKLREITPVLVKKAQNLMQERPSGASDEAKNIPPAYVAPPDDLSTALQAITVVDADHREAVKNFLRLVFSQEGVTVASAVQQLDRLMAKCSEDNVELRIRQIDIVIRCIEQCKDEYTTAEQSEKVQLAAHAHGFLKIECMLVCALYAITEDEPDLKRAFSDIRKSVADTRIYKEELTQGYMQEQKNRILRLCANHEVQVQKQCALPKDATLQSSKVIPSPFKGGETDEEKIAVLERTIAEVRSHPTMAQKERDMLLVIYTKALEEFKRKKGK